MNYHTLYDYFRHNTHMYNLWLSRSRICGVYYPTHTYLQVHATSERFLPAWATFRASIASESHWLQQVSVLTVHWSFAPVSVGGLYVNLSIMKMKRHRTILWPCIGHFWNKYFLNG